MCTLKIAIVFLFASVCNVHSQLLRPIYNITCVEYETIFEKLNFNRIVDDNSTEVKEIKIHNPFNMKIDTAYFVFPSKTLNIFNYNDSVITIMSLNSYSNLKEINNLIVLGKYGQNCSDTIMNISINYTAQLFKKIRFLGRVELGYLNNGITYSDKSILTKERYLILSNSGLSLGCELVEYRTPVLYLGMSVGVNAYLTTLMNVKSDSSINKVSLTDLMVNIRWDLPFYFIQKSLKDLSFRCYLTFPFLYSGSLSPGLNDNNNLQLYMGVGLNYNLTRWSALEFRSILVNYDSNNSSLLSGSKINYNTVKSELIFSFTNVYDNLYELLSE